MSKIQISTVKMTADVEVINVSAYLVAQVVRAQMRADSLVEQHKHVKKDYDKETHEWKDVLDKNGNQTFCYDDTSTQTVEEYILPLLNELMEAFGVKDNRV